MTISGLPFDDIRDLMAALPPADQTAGSLARERSADLAQQFTFGSDAGFDADTWLAEWSGKTPKVSRPVLALFAGTHKVADHYGEAPGETALDIVTRLAAGGSPANQVCAAADIGLKAFDLALQFPVEDISAGEAMDEKGSAATIGFGMEAIAGGVDLLGLAAFGQGGEIASAVMLTILLGGKPADWLVMPASADAAQTAIALELCEKALGLHSSKKDNPLELLRSLGGREFSAIAGAMLSARSGHVPVVAGGMTALAVQCLLEAEQKGSTAHCRFALSRGNEPASRAARIAGIGTISAEMPEYVDGAAVAGVMSAIRLGAEIHSASVLA